MREREPDQRAIEVGHCFDEIRVLDGEPAEHRAEVRVLPQRRLERLGAGLGGGGGVARLHPKVSYRVRCEGTPFKSVVSPAEPLQQIAIRFSDAAVAVPSDIWFDNVEVTSAP